MICLQRLIYQNKNKLKKVGLLDSCTPDMPLIAGASSMNEAAGKLFISQPSLSASIKELGRRLSRSF